MAAPTEAEIDRIVAGVNNANRAADYADTVVFEPTLIEGNRYKYVLTNEYTPPDGD